MTRIPRPRTRSAALAALACTIALAAAATPAQAGIGVFCPDPTSQPFQTWGDDSFYAFAPNGGFENGANRWSVTGGAKVVAGSEPFAVHARSDAHSLFLPTGSTATSAPMCIGLLSTKMRFFARNSGTSTARLRVQAIYSGGLGQVLGIGDVGTITAGRWTPSPEFTLLGGIAPLLTQDVQFRFTALDAGGSWQIDDLYLDPLMHR